MLQVAVDRGIAHAKLNLRPVELGGIEIRLQTSAAGVTAQVIADSPEAAKLLEQAAGDLRRALERQDVTPLSLDVSTAGETASAAPAGASPDFSDEDGPATTACRAATAASPATPDEQPAVETPCSCPTASSSTSSPDHEPNERPMDATSIKSLGSPAAATQSASGKNADMGKDQFLKLFVAQLQHQDPMNPMQDSDFMGQMASFSTLEQITNLASPRRRTAARPSASSAARSPTPTSRRAPTPASSRRSTTRRTARSSPSAGTAGVNPSTITQIA